MKDKMDQIRLTLGTYFSESFLSENLYSSESIFHSKYSDGKIGHMVKDLKDYSSLRDSAIIRGIIEELEKKRDSLMGFGSRSHGSCCYCEDCHHFHDDCTCREIKVYDSIINSLKACLN